MIVSPNPLARDGLKRLLQERLQLIVTESDGLESEQPADLQIRLVLLAPDHGPVPLAQLVGDACRVFPGARVVVLEGSTELTRLASAFAAGASGYLLQKISSDAFVESIRLILMGEKVFPSALAGMLNGRPPHLSERHSSVTGKHARLSSREIEIVNCLIDGKSNKLIARELEIAEATVKVHLKTILRKTQTGNRTQIAIWAVCQGIASGIPSTDASDDKASRSERPSA